MFLVAGGAQTISVASLLVKFGSFVPFFKKKREDHQFLAPNQSRLENV